MSRQLAKVITDSVSPCGQRLTTLEVAFPRIVLAEFNTHRVLSRNSASSRAIPIQKMLRLVAEDPYIPERWGKNGKGMQDHGELSEDEADHARRIWLASRDDALYRAKCLLKAGVHKQTTNRLLEPFMWHTVIVTATEWSNFLNLRCHPDAHPAIRRTAEAIRDAREESKPRVRQWGEWHLPYLREDEQGLDTSTKLMVSTARCARVSYLTHDGKRDIEKDIELHDRLLKGGHMSPFEHPAICSEEESLARGDYPALSDFIGNFRQPWKQYRKHIPWEHDIKSKPEVGAA